MEPINRFNSTTQQNEYGSLIATCYKKKTCSSTHRTTMSSVDNDHSTYTRSTELEMIRILVLAIFDCVVFDPGNEN